MIINKESISPDIPYSAAEMDFVHTFIQICQYIYEETSFDSPITDTEYDILYAIMVANSETEEFAQPIYHTKNNLAHHKYPTLRGTLKKVYYLTDDDSIEIGDSVLVPAGKDNHEVIVEVVNIEYFSEENVPLTVEKTKKIIQKCIEDRVTINDLQSE